MIHLGLTGFDFFLSIIILHIVIVAIPKAFIFKKAGQESYNAFIPFYGDFDLNTVVVDRGFAVTAIVFKIIVTLFVVVFLMIGFLSGFIILLIGYLPKIHWNLVEFIGFMIILAPISWPLLLLFVMRVTRSIGLSRKFGKGYLFAAGLTFLPIIFYPILAFGKAKYNSELKQ